MNRKRMFAIFKTTIACTAATLMLTSAAWSQSPKYIFLFIGDGLGIPQRSATVQFTGDNLVFDSFPAQGITTTYAADRFITGSAAAATALSAGEKTNIGVVGMNAQLEPVPTIAEIARDKGMKVGIISSVSLDHATPAAFYAHVPQRSMYYDIDLALAKSGFDYFAGGGLKDPGNKRNNSSNFEGDALELAKANGYIIITGRQQFKDLKKGASNIIAINGWLQDSGAMPYSMDTTKEDVSLAEFTQKGIELLDNPEGFFIMVEGGKIDWACHANDGAAAIRDTIAFDAAVGKAFEFYNAHPNETLIVVTGDHETGGMTLGFAGTKYQSNFSLLKSQNVSFQKFRDTVIAEVTKEGSQASFDDIKPSITTHFNLRFEGDAKDPMLLKAHEIKQLEEAFGRTVAGDTSKSKDPETYLLYGGYDPLTVTITHIVNQKAGIAWTSYKHTGLPVSTAAIGVGAERFQGMYDNTDVAKKIKAIAGFETTIATATVKN